MEGAVPGAGAPQLAHVVGGALDVLGLPGEGGAPNSRWRRVGGQPAGPARPKGEGGGALGEKCTFQGACTREGVHPKARECTLHSWQQLGLR